MISGAMCESVIKMLLLLFLYNAIYLTNTIEATIVQGLFPAVFSPMDGNGQINVSVIPEYATYLKNYGIEGVVVGGTTGEGPALTLKDRKELLSAWKEAAGSDLKVISQVGGQVFLDVLDMANYSERLGVFAILTLPELYFKPKTSEKLVEFLERVSKAAPSTPLLYYDYPQKTEVNVDLAELFALASSRIPSFLGTKSGLSRSVQIKASNKLRYNQTIYVAEPALLAASYELGFNTNIGAAANIFPELTIEIIRATQDGDIKKARVLQEKLNEIVAVINAEGDFEPTMKAAMETVTGIVVGDVRYPLNQLTVQQKRTMARKLEALGVGVKRRDLL